MTHAALRLLLQAAEPPPGTGGVPPPPPPPAAATTSVGTGQPDQTIPTTAAVVGGVVGGLSILTLCLAVALVFAVASIYGWRVFGRKKDGGEAGGGRKQSDVQSLLEAGRERSRLPSIVTARLASSEESSPQHSGAQLATAQTALSDMTAYPSGLQAKVSASSSVQTHASPLTSDVSWKDCLIEAEKIQILRRRDGKPWVLGGGAFGQVFKALYDGVQVVAAKVLTGLADERILQSFLNEAAILRDMRDKNIVQFVGICMGSEEEGQPDEAMMIQEFMEAGDLFHALKWRDQAGRRVFGWHARGKRAACDIARGLHYLHSHKIVHLDMKSSNVLLARDGTCKIADVGLARSLRTKAYLTQAGTMGTFAWSAPEVLTGQPCTVMADIYSMGIILWEIVTGEIPNRGTMRNPMVPDECPQEIIDLIDRCTSMDSKQRPSAKEIVQLLEGLPLGTPSRAEARGANLRSASLAHWRDKLPQQISKLPSTLTSSAEEPDAEHAGPQTLTDDAEELQMAAEYAAEEAKHGPPPAPPQATLRLEDLPPLSDEEKMF